jgi:hypothetical protein
MKMKTNLEKLFESLRNRSEKSARKCIKLAEKIAPIRVTFVKDLAPRCPVCGRFTHKGDMIWNGHKKGEPLRCVKCYDEYKNAHFERLERLAELEGMKRREELENSVWKKHKVPKIFSNIDQNMPDTDVDPELKWKGELK